MKTYILSICLLLIVAPVGATPAIDTGSARVWGDDHFSVIVAKVKELKIEKDHLVSPDHAVLEPIATIAGGFDCSAVAQLPVDLDATPGETGDFPSRNPFPPAGHMVLAVIRQDPSDSSCYIPGEVCFFMPGDFAFAKITGLDDPLVAQTLKNIREKRLAGQPSTRPTTAPTTKP